MPRPRLDWRLQGESRSPVVRAKVEWANHHRGLLSTALEDLRDRDPYFVHKDHRTREGRRYLVLIAHPEPAPEAIGQILGDFVHNLRGALDYMVGAMRIGGPSRNYGFPICIKRPIGPHGFRDRFCVALRDIPDEAVKLIHWMQPYHRPDLALRHDPKRRVGWAEGSFRDALRALEVLRNVAEHRTLLVATSATKPLYVGVKRADGESSGVGFRMYGPNNTSEIWLPADEEFDPHFEIQVALAEPRGFAADWLRWFGEWTLEELVDYLHRAIRYEVIPQFNPFIQ